MDAITKLTSTGTYITETQVSISQTTTEGQTAATPSAIVELGTPDSQTSSGTYASTIEAMKKEAETRYQNLRQMVEELITQQTGISVKVGQNRTISPEVQQEAQKEIGVGGYYSPESVASRILDFAKALSGGDASKFNLLKDSVEKGFAAATETLGGKLPDISQETYKLVQKGFDEWAEELGIADSSDTDAAQTIE